MGNMVDASGTLGIDHVMSRTFWGLVLSIANLSLFYVVSGLSINPMADQACGPSLPSRIASLVHAHFDALPTRSKPTIFPDGSREWVPMTGIVVVKGMLKLLAYSLNTS